MSPLLLFSTATIIALKVPTALRDAEELVGEALQELGTVYRLHGTPEVARQHLTRALAIRKKCHGEKSLKVAETLNSLALVHQTYAFP